MPKKKAQTKTTIPQVRDCIPLKVAMERIKIIETAPQSGGRTKLLKYLYGGRLSRGDAAVAKCCECMNNYIDGRVSCGIVTCPLYPYMPYRKVDT